MPSNLKPDQMKQFVGKHFEDFVNARNAAVIRQNMTPDFYDHDGPGGKPTGVWRSRAGRILRTVRSTSTTRRRTFCRYFSIRTRSSPSA